MTMSDKQDSPQGFILSEAAQYSFAIQDVYQDIIAFSAAIPEHLRPLFLIPIKLEPIYASETVSKVAQDMTPSGHTDDADLFGTKTFVYDDNTSDITTTDPGSIFDIDGGDGKTHHQEYNFDENIESPSETSYMTDVDITEVTSYPYRTNESPVRHSSDKSSVFKSAYSRVASSTPRQISRLQGFLKNVPKVVFLRLALKSESLLPRTPEKTKERAGQCSVSLTSYDPKTKIFTFSVLGTTVPRAVRTSLSAIDEISLSCDCPFWRWNGPEFHAKSDNYMLGKPFGTASPPDIRDPERKHFLCKHAYAVLRRMDDYVAQIVDENWELSDDELLEHVDNEWDRLSESREIPVDEESADEADLTIDWDMTPLQDKTDETEDEQTSEKSDDEFEDDDGSIDIDVMDFSQDQDEPEIDIESQTPQQDEEFEISDEPQDDDFEVQLHDIEQQQQSE